MVLVDIVEALLHYVLIFVALGGYGLDPVAGALMSVFALLPDFDVFFGIHRSNSHSLVLLLAIGVPITVILWIVGIGEIATLALFALVSHPILDVFGGYAPFFWPISSRFVKFRININLSSESSLKINIEADLIEKEDYEDPMNFQGALITGRGLILALIILLPFLVDIIEYIPF